MMTKKQCGILVSLVIVTVAIFSAVGVLLAKDRNSDRGRQAGARGVVGQIDLTASPSEPPVFLPSMASYSPEEDPIQRPRESSTTQSPTEELTSSPTTPSPVTPPALSTALPSVVQSIFPSKELPSLVSSVPTTDPTEILQTEFPTGAFTVQRSLSPSACFTPTNSFTTFYAIADVPYTAEERAELPRQIKALPSDAEFLIHLGDIRSAREGHRCMKSQYTKVAETLKLSKAPVFIIMGDNEWNDCPNINGGWNHWHEVFDNFEDHWDHSFQVVRPEDRTENFAFVHKKTLFVGLNLVGGRVHKPSEWRTRLKDQVEWTKELILNHTGVDRSYAACTAVVIFGHANPALSHNDFFGPLRAFIQNILKNRIPILYMNGDGHDWRKESNFFGQRNYMRVQLSGGTMEPPLKFMVNTSSVLNNINDAFSYDRRL